MNRQFAYLLLIIVLCLMGTGMVMLLSVSARYATSADGAQYTSLYRQLMWTGMGGVVCVVLSRTDYHTVVRWGPWLLLAACVLLLLVFVPGLGRTVNGSTRWIGLMGFTFQPSEFAKLALIVFLAWWMTRYQRQAGTLVLGFLVPGLAVAFLGALTLKQPDLGVTAMFGVIFFVVMFCAGVRKRYLLPIPPLGIAGILALAYYMPERRGRLIGFLNPLEYRDNETYQVVQALIALGSGGPNGLGLGNSRQKFNYLPEADTDFIFPILGEELGLWVALAVVLAFVLLTLAGGWISLHAPDPTGVYLGIGLTTALSVQAMINLMVITSMIPTKGMPLPFISYGGSNLLLCLAGVGILFNLARQGITLSEPEGAGILPSRSSLRL